MLTLAHPEPGEELLVRVGPTRQAIVSWNALALEGALELRFNAHDGRTSAWLPYVRFDARTRRSFDGRDTFVRIETDVVRADVDLVTVGVRTSDRLDALFVSIPDYGAPSPIVALPAVALDVPPYSQYEPKYPDERGWCTPAALAMLLAYRDYPVDLPVVAREVFDARYGGTGNWTFNAAFAGNARLSGSRRAFARSRACPRVSRRRHSARAFHRMARRSLAERAASRERGAPRGSARHR